MPYSNTSQIIPHTHVETAILRHPNNSNCCCSKQIRLTKAILKRTRSSVFQFSVSVLSETLNIIHRRPLILVVTNYCQLGKAQWPKRSFAVQRDLEYSLRVSRMSGTVRNKTVTETIHRFTKIKYQQ